MSIDSLVRKHVRKLKPYSSARDEFTGSAEIYLDANESPFRSKLGVNRYPDPLQRDIKALLSKRLCVDSNSIFIGNGSDEALDVLIRTVVDPLKDEIIICPPTYGMYAVLGEINQSVMKEVPLREDFSLDVPSILQALSKDSKIIFLCSPNNPTGNALLTADIEKILNSTDALVVIDEAYIHFANTPSWLDRLSEFQNLAILQTFSKAWGLAGLRLGVLYADKNLIGYMNKVKYPYNINSASQIELLSSLEHEESMRANVSIIKDQREELQRQLNSLDCVDAVYPSDANFLLVKVKDADAIYELLCKKKIIVRNRTKELHCRNCLRITVGTLEENQKLVEVLKDI